MDSVKETVEHFAVNDLPDEFGHLGAETQPRAIAMVHAFLDEGHRREIAIGLALDGLNTSSTLTSNMLLFHVVPHSRGWAVVKADTSHTMLVTKSKQRAIDYGRRVANSQHGLLTIYDQNGILGHEVGYQNQNDSITEMEQQR